MCKIRRSKTLSCFSKLSRVNLYSATQPVGFSRPTHDWFGPGGKSQADELPIKDGDPSLLEFKIQKSKENNCFDSLRELASQVRVGHGIDIRNLEKHLQPYGKPQESFDGLVFSKVGTLILLQCTMTERYGIKPYRAQGLSRELSATIEHICIVFVVPNDHADNYANSQKVPDADALGLQAGQSIKQPRLVFPNEDIELLIK